MNLEKLNNSMFIDNIYNNLEKLNDIFPPKIYEKLTKYKEQNSKDEFREILDISLEASENLKDELDYFNLLVIQGAFNVEILEFNNILIRSNINNIKIQNFKLLKNFELTLSDKLNILIGENSKGKTSLLQAITLGLLDDFRIGTYQEKFKTYITKNEKNSTIILNFGNFSKTLKIYPNKKEFDNDYFKPFLLLAYGSNIFTIYDKIGDDIAEEILNKKGKNYFVESIFKDYHNGLYNPKNVLKSLDYLGKKEENRQRIKEVKKEFIEVINSFLDNFELVEKDGSYFFENEFEKELKLEDLSEGYRNNILLISDIMIHILSNGETSKTIKGFILIDEFDRHLHPTWQSKLVTKLKETFPNIQFILTTHNPMSILDREAEEIINLEITKDGIKAVQKDIGTKTIDVGTVLLKYFKVDSLVGKSMKDKIERFTNLKIKDDLSKQEEKELIELEEFLEDTVATNFIYNNAYFGFLKFVKKHENIDFEKDELNDLSDEELDKLLNEYKESIV